MKKLILIFLLHVCLYPAHAQVGIGTSAPRGGLQVQDSSVLFSAEGDVPAVVTDSISISGSFTNPNRIFLWYPQRASLFATGRSLGFTTTSLGNYTVMLGTFLSGSITGGSGVASTCMNCSGSTAPRGDYSTSGTLSNSSGKYGTALGFGSLISGAGSTAIGYGNNGTGAISTTLGFYNAMNGDTSTVIGENNTISGMNATAIGSSNLVNGNYSVAIGNNNKANSNNSVVIGNYATTQDFMFRNFSGVFLAGDANGTLNAVPVRNNQMVAGFRGGIKFFTDSNATVGVRLAINGNGWSTISDVHVKENFAPVSGEDFLERVAGFQLTSWNYKSQSPAAFRHYGPMAQDFYQAFGRDDYGTIGNSTTINQADFDGVNLIAIQALEKRTRELQQENEELEQLVARLEALLGRKKAANSMQQTQPISITPTK